VLVARCPEHDCEFRLGSRWVADRFAGAREPHLRPSAPRERLRLVEAALEDGAALAAALEGFRVDLARLGAPAREARLKRAPAEVRP
jgi:coenzyme F420-reducing hydrogenase delta subunit